MKRLHFRRQRGIALIAFLAIVAIGVSALILKHLNDESGLIAAVRKNRNAEVLNRAKQALIGYVAHQAAVSGENNPGAFPCPEAPAGYGSTTGTDGRTQTPSCTLPAVGRFPWRTVGTDMLVDSAGEPLWYVVASGWSKPSAAGNTVINSNCTTDPTPATMECFSGQLTVDGQANAAVALIIAPGPAFKTVVGAGCTTAVNQVRPATGAPNLANYLECENATNPADASFVTTGPSGSFNDQVVKITAAEVLPVIEGAIAERFQKEFAPTLRAAYSASPWPVAQVLPFAAAFGNPTADPLQGAAVISTGTASVANGSAVVTLSAAPALSLTGRHFRVQGSADAYLISAHTLLTPLTLTLSSAFTGATNGAVSYQVFVAGGLLPANYAFTGQCTCAGPPCVCPTPVACNPATDGPRCDPAFVSWRSTATLTATGGGGIDPSSSCSVSGPPTTLTCTLNTYFTIVQLFGPGLTFNLDATANNAGMTWRKLNAPPTAPAITGIDTSYANSPIGYSVTSASMNTDGSATIRVNARVPAFGGSVLAVLGSITCDFFGIPLCFAKTVSVPMALLGDQDVFDPNNTATNWFFRNRWHEVSYYAVAPNVTPSGPHSCATSSTCLQLTRHVNDGKHRGLLAIGGPKIAAQARPALVAADLLDGTNALGASPFEKHSATLLPNRAFNDHFAVIDSNP